MAHECPDPLDDPDGYSLWCEANACKACQGEGVRKERIEWCNRCDGTGIDPDASHGFIRW